jgi:CheY-like chemotaxis protein
MAQKILIVDDDAHIRMLIEQTLEELEDEGVEFLTAENGQDAIEKLESAAGIDLVLMDVMMPGMDGYESMSESEAGTPLAMFTLLLTAKDEIDRLKGRVGADVYMTKPSIEIILSKPRQYWTPCKPTALLYQQCLYPRFDNISELIKIYFLSLMLTHR